MSNQLCSVRTINALVSFSMVHNIRLCLNNGDVMEPRLHPQVVASLLLDANLASMRASYKTEPVQERVIEFRPADLADLDPVVILKTANFFNYHACEAADYNESDAAALMRHIIQNAIRAIPAYAAAPWGLDGVEPAPVWLGETQKRMEAAKPVQRSILDMCFPSGAVDLEEKPLQPITRATLATMGPKPTPTPAKQPAKKQPKPNDNDQPDGPF